MSLRPYLPSAKPLASNYSDWPYRARRTFDSADRVVRVYYAPDVLSGMEYYKLAKSKDRNPAEQAKLIRDGLDAGHVATVYIRSTEAVTYVLVQRWVDNTCEGSVYFNSAGGYGYDRQAAALDGIPLWLPPEGSDRPPCILTDHCGLDGYAHPFDPRKRAVLLNDLPPGYFTL